MRQGSTIAYNNAVPKPSNTAAGASGRRSRTDRWRALRAEAIGLILIALAILLFTVLRYGARINWSAR